MEAVNLLPAYARPSHRLATVGKDLTARRVLTGGAAAAAVAVLGMGLGYVHERSVVSDMKTELADVQTQVAAADAKAAPLRAAQAAAAARMTTAATISSQRVAWEKTLHDLSRVLPGQVYLQSLSIQSPTPLASGATASVPAAVGTGFTATGVASSHIRVALVLDRLDSLPWLSNVMLVSSTHGASGGTNGSLSTGDTFTVSAGFDPTGGAK